MKQFSRLAATVLLSLSTVSMFANNNAETPAAGNNEVAEVLNIQHAQGNNSRTMTYQKSTPMTLPDGTVVSQGDLKPTWQYIEKQLGFKISDNTVQDQKGSEMIDISAASAFKDDTVYGGQSIIEDLMNYGAQGYFLNLKDYLDKMPNFKMYLDLNPNVAKAITAYDGGIYFAPYTAEIGNYARGFEGRPAWVMALLDSTSELETETHTLNVAYEGFWDRFDVNPIAAQNAAAANGVLTRDAALAALLSHIKTNHPNLAKPSDLYLGDTAVYDMDELVALWRVIELSPNTLSKVTTGKVVEGAEISPFFPRQSKYRYDVLRLLFTLDGTRVHSSDSENARNFVDANGQMHYSYAEDDFLNKVNYLQQWYSEGLIFSEFSDLSNKDNFRKSLLFSDSVEGQRQFGFMTFDWFASTTKGTDKAHVMLPPVTTITKAGINDFVHYVENTRAIKPDGWSISAAAPKDQQNAAFMLFDYMYSEEGHLVQNYSIPAAREKGGKFIGPDGTEYPKFSQWTLDAAAEYKNGDISGFLRDFMGSLLTVGYQKEIGFELQITSKNGFKGWDLYTKMGVLTPSYDAYNQYLRMMPPVLSLNDQDNAKLGTVAVGDSQNDMIYLFISGDGSVVSSTDQIKKEYLDGGLETYISVYQAAYDRMMGK